MAARTYGQRSSGGSEEGTLTPRFQAWKLQLPSTRLCSMVIQRAASAAAKKRPSFWSASARIQR
ncbi:MAG TPA: hypothetical protein DCM87_21540 [Planctomycetes bacterium]|nr:hypothetical protein [Planctomycetota bacterium]